MIKLTEILEIKNINGKKVPFELAKKNVAERLRDPGGLSDDVALAHEIESLGIKAEFIDWLINWEGPYEAVKILIDSLIQF